MTATLKSLPCFTLSLGTRLILVNACRFRNPKPPRARRSGRRTAGPWGGAYLGRTACRCSIGQEVNRPYSPGGNVDNRPEHLVGNTNKGNPMKNKKRRQKNKNKYLSTLSTIHLWFITRTTSVLRSWLLTSVPALICLLKFFKSCTEHVLILFSVVLKC